VGCWCSPRTYPWTVAHAAVLVLQVFVYLAGLQLLLTSGRKSIIVMVASTLAGVLYRLNFCGVRRLRVSSSSVWS
jgi:hypothetical protein